MITLPTPDRSEQPLLAASLPVWCRECNGTIPVGTWFRTRRSDHLPVHAEYLPRWEPVVIEGGRDTGGDAEFTDRSGLEMVGGDR